MRSFGCFLILSLWDGRFGPHTMHTAPLPIPTCFCSFQAPASLHSTRGQSDLSLFLVSRGRTYTLVCFHHHHRIGAFSTQIHSRRSVWVFARFRHAITRHPVAFPLLLACLQSSLLFLLIAITPSSWCCRASRGSCAGGWGTAASRSPPPPVKPPARMDVRRSSQSVKRVHA